AAVAVGFVAREPAALPRALAVFLGAGELARRVPRELLVPPRDLAATGGRMTSGSGAASRWAVAIGHLSMLLATIRPPSSRPAPVVQGNTCRRWTTAGRRTPVRTARAAS